MRQNILEQNPRAELKVYAIWLSVLGAETRADWDSTLLDDPRVEHFWDENRLVGTWLGEQTEGDLNGGGGLVWDAYLAFGPGARWGERLSGLVGFGSPVIGDTGALKRDLARALGRA